MALYRYKLCNLFQISFIEFSEVVMFEPWIQHMCDRKLGFFFFFLAFLRLLQLPLGL